MTVTIPLNVTVISMVAPAPYKPRVVVVDTPVGDVAKRNWSAAEVVEMPPGVVTVTSTVPLDSAGLVAVICVAETTVKLLAAVVPKSTAVAPLRPVPVIVTRVPPARGPIAGLMLVTVGTAA